MARKVFCKNTTCKHRRKGDICDTTVKIGYGGGCESFEKGIVYYFHLVWNALDNKNFIDINELNDDLRIGLYYVMKAYKLTIHEYEWGTWRIIALQESEDGPKLKYEDIIARGMDDEVWNEIWKDFQEGKLPSIKKEKAKKESQPFGWLSPTGDFVEGDWGEHEVVAYNIIKSKGWKEEFRAWDTDDLKLKRDFLCQVKGYCLIHNPSMNGGYIVTNIKPLTKKQKDFLYGYFMDIGDRFKAEQYVD